MINRIIAVYPGRFQPMGRHHKATYDWMVGSFGAENSFIVTSDKVVLPDSPFGFEEKSSKMKNNFFNLGKQNKWQKTLDKDIEKIIINEFQEEMKELNYL